MDANNAKRQSNEEPAPPGTSPKASSSFNVIHPDTPRPPPPLTSIKGVENAKKRLRAFSIQKKTTPLSPIVPKPISTGNTTVLIGKLSSVKTTEKKDKPKLEDEAKKPPKPPKPGSTKKPYPDSYPDQQKRTLKEIEDMKRKMELVELGIPLGLICPTSTNEKAMPTKAMPPIKTFLDEAKVDEIIREAKKIRGEGKEYKFDYNKLLPDYDNPFQRKKDDFEREYKSDRRRSESKRDKKSDKYEFKRHPSHRKSDKDKFKERDRERSKDRTRSERKEESKETEEKEIDINLKDYSVCDSWSAETDDKTNSPKVEEKPAEPKSPVNPNPESTLPQQEKITEKIHFKITKDPSQQLKENQTKKVDVISEVIIPLEKPRKIEKLQPVIDSFKFEIDEPNEDEVLDIFDEESTLEKYSQVRSKRSTSSQSPVAIYDQDMLSQDRDASMDMNDDTFLESVINEIRQDDNMCDETSQDKRLVEYDESPNKDDYDSPVAQDLKQRARASVTPELDDKMREQTKLYRENFDKKKKGDFSDRKGQSSQRSDYSDGVRSSESGYKTSDTTESNTKYENFSLSVEKELDEALARSNIAKATMESMETWSFVLKICQPLLFRHDRNKCIRVTQTYPKITYATNPKGCLCIKDRTIVYQELEMLKMGLVDRVYGRDQLPDTLSVNARAWYPVASACLAEGKVQPVASEWEADDSQQGENSIRSMTPQRNEEIMLDREYQRFMEAVWPEVAEAKAKETSRSTTPIQQDSREKKKEEKEEEKKAKKIKLSSEGWSQESDIEVEPEKRKKPKDKEKTRKRKRSTSPSTISDSDSSSKKKRKLMKKKALKRAKSKEAKRRRIGKKLLKKLKEKQKKQKKAEKAATEDIEFEKEKKKELKKAKKRKQEKLKKKNQKRKKKESSSNTSSSTSSSSSSTDSDSDRTSKKRKRSQEKKKKKRKKSSSDSQEDLFDVNILNNIKTERLTDDEKGQKLMEFSPRVHHKLREIINVKELQNDFVGNNNIMIKQEVEEKLPESEVEITKEVTLVQVENAEVQKEITEVEKEGEKIVEKDDSVNLDHMVVSPPTPTVEKEESIEFKEPPEPQESSGAPIAVIDESNLSRSSSQESVCSVKETSSYEKDESHLRPSSQNSNYSFNDVIASQGPSPGLHRKAPGVEAPADSRDKYEAYELDAGSYELYERLAMAYQSDVASQASTSLDGVCAGPAGAAGAGGAKGAGGAGGAAEAGGAEGVGGAGGAAGALQRIETVVGGGARGGRAARGARGEIKCDWRADHSPAAPLTHRPSRWGLKPSEVNIVLTSGDYAPQASPQPVYKIQSLANRTEVQTDYDEAYMDMYGASDRLQYGDCFAADAADVRLAAATNATTATNLTSLANLAQLVNVTQVQTHITHIEQVPAEGTESRSTLDARIDQALRETVLGEVAKHVETVEEQKDVPEKGILLTGTVSVSEPARGVKRVSFADGYKPGQDSDVEEPPVKKRRPRAARRGCAWPCPAAHPDHVPLWDALPPPPPPPGDPPAPPASCRYHHATHPTTESGIPLGGFMPPEPPPGLISF